MKYRWSVVHPNGNGSVPKDNKNSLYRIQSLSIYSAHVYVYLCVSVLMHFCTFVFFSRSFHAPGNPAAVRVIRFGTRHSHGPCTGPLDKFRLLPRGPSIYDLAPCRMCCTFGTRSTFFFHDVLYTHSRNFFTPPRRLAW